MDVSKEEMDKELNHVKQLIYPSDTVMDLSIGIALWFASKGNGQLLQGGDYHSEAKVLIVGMGADEQLAGYSRHRVKFEMEGLSGLLNEIQLDLDRISIRNLGRDDRVISDNGKEARFPFLDEQVVEFFSSLPISVKCDLSLPRGFGEKKLLRSLARHLKIESAASLPKRAIQFGSKTAKIFSSKESGSDSLFS